ncbi:hypothetical protein [Actinomadura sp. NAK00032]|uniref:hypothetical protein n=1 Tax=Actinomadura sp. NAK00032 TaxID=2742128 RepID=UPI001C378116|nr:hypothetical protein [Actinomadura sp. NAK00032]
MRISLPSLAVARRRSPSLAVDEADRLTRAAQRACPYSSATRANMDVSVVVNGEQV